MTLRIAHLTRRSEFLHAAAKGRKSVMPGLVLQAVCPANWSKVAENSGVNERCFRVGYTASRRVGGAVARNRAKRRLRAAVARVMPERAKVGRNYVVIARAATLDRDFEDLLQDLKTALARVDAKTAEKSGPSSAN